jgi:sialate O-acetylesterase
MGAPLPSRVHSFHRVDLARFAGRLGLALAAAFSSARADVTLAPLFADHAVLQSGKTVPVWGRADPGEKVTVKYREYAAAGLADLDGRWVALLPPMPAQASGADLIATGKNSISVHDVVVGDVWLCSGQSNMEFPVYDPNSQIFHLKNGEKEAAAANFPPIRQFAVSRQVADKPAETVKGAWAVCSPETAGRFTAVGYFFARDIFRRFGVPVGIIDSTWGGTPVESWMSPAALASDPAFAVIGERWKQALAEYPAKKTAFDPAIAEWAREEAVEAAAGKARHAAFLKTHPKPREPVGPGSSWMPAGLFNGMINPLLPFGIRGILWYQGESNAGRASEYHNLFSAMVTEWRSNFGQGDLPFYWVQLASYKVPDDPTGATWAWLREAQTQTLSLPATGQASAIDIGDPDNIHPADKQEVGRRLALIAKARVYGISVDYSGPVFSSATVEGNSIRVRFEYADNGLTAAGKPLQSFELAGADRKFHPASASISGSTVVVRSAEVPAPVAVRYAWQNAPEANLFNGAGLPATPFRSDDW